MENNDYDSIILPEQHPFNMSTYLNSLDSNQVHTLYVQYHEVATRHANIGRYRIVDLSITAATTSKALRSFGLDCRRSNTSLLAWIVYDFILTFSDEIKFMWTSQISITTILLFILRYGALFRQVLHMCDFLHLDISNGASTAW